MTDVDTILKRVQKNGITIIPSSRENTSLSKKKGELCIFKNRKMKKSVVIDDKKLKELLGTDFL